ncbi:zinc finger MYM-type protein 1-like [Prunus persica]|uniref:zinc finger MYM-type protein 1-like n=1 Tax=Prunus persica TaxID=3760 RepID=UPI0009AB5B25|nr:zinc finger MYM-type protein 1-like [Prunus persica]
MNIEVEKVVLDKAPQNAQYIAHDIQKQILHIFANKVRKAICKELWKNKFCILVDESIDESGKEQMAIIIRFVDCDGFIRERFFDIVSVVDTNALTLKKEICKVLGNNDILVENMRGQEYDDASNMRGSWNGLQGLFFQDCPYTYYVHCFAHCLQLALNGAAKDVKVLWRLFLMLTNIVNFVSASAKHRSELNLIRKVELNGLLDSGELEIGRGLNQARSLKRAGATSWGSHYASITSLLCLFKETKLLLQEINDHGPNQQFRGDAESNYIAMMSFEFVFSLVLMDKNYGIDQFSLSSISDQNSRHFELLILSSALDPRNSFKSFNIEHICKLAEKFYPADFLPNELKDLEIELRLIRLVLTLPVSTATTERAFSCMRIIKNRLRSTIADEFLVDCMTFHIEREFANSITNASIIEEFKTSKSRRMYLRVRLIMPP